MSLLKTFGKPVTKGKRQLKTSEQYDLKFQQERLKLNNEISEAMYKEDGLQDLYFLVKQLRDDNQFYLDKKKWIWNNGELNYTSEQIMNTYKLQQEQLQKETELKNSKQFEDDVSKTWWIPYTVPLLYVLLLIIFWIHDTETMVIFYLPIGTPIMIILTCILRFSLAKLRLQFADDYGISEDNKIVQAEKKAKVASVSVGVATTGFVAKEMNRKIKKESTAKI